MGQKTSLLTEKQREFLTNKEKRDSLTRQGANQTRKRIRRRWRDALLDCRLLLDNIDEVGPEKLLDPVGEDMSEDDEPKIRSGIASAICLCYLMYERPNARLGDEFDMIVGNAIQSAMQANGYEATVFVDIDITDVEPVSGVVARALDKDPTERSVRESKALLRGGEITIEEYRRTSEETHDEGDDDE